MRLFVFSFWLQPVHNRIDDDTSQQHFHPLTALEHKIGMVVFFMIWYEPLFLYYCFFFLWGFI